MPEKPLACLNDGFRLRRHGFWRDAYRLLARVCVKLGPLVLQCAHRQCEVAQALFAQPFRRLRVLFALRPLFSRVLPLRLLPLRALLIRAVRVLCFLARRGDVRALPTLFPYTTLFRFDRKSVV